jgi:3-oxo-4-pregnene-20-carboxyl-CoA dehydrogenase alpha subunit
MDFTHGEAELEISRLAAQILGAAASEDPDGGGSPPAETDTATWKELAQAGLLAVALPKSAGGDGLGVMAVAALLTEVGRHAARVPALATLALGVLPVTRCGSPAAQQQLLAGVATGETVLTAAIREPSAPMPAEPATIAELSGDAGTVTGVKLGVPYAALARWILVPASLAGASAVGPRSVVVVVESGSTGLTCQPTHTSAGMPEYTVRLDRVQVRHVLSGDPMAGDPMASGPMADHPMADHPVAGDAVAGDAVAELYRLAVAGACCVADGGLAGALALTTDYIKSREQFGRPLATFQAVAQQIADVYVTARILHLATMSACWRLDTGRDASGDVDVAGYWLAEHGPLALRTCHHLHGGIGMDVTYPLPRFSALITDLVSLVGGASYRLDLLGEREGA